MKTSQAGIDLIKSFEGFQSHPYLCPAGRWTIGYGMTHGVTSGSKPVSELEATAMLAKTLEKFEGCVLHAVEADLQQCEFDACVSLAYNIGGYAFENSTLVKYLNNHEYEKAADQFLRWDKANGKPLAGLTRRRKAEREMFLNGAKHGT